MSRVLLKFFGKEAFWFLRESYKKLIFFFLGLKMEFCSFSCYWLLFYDYKGNLGGNWFSGCSGDRLKEFGFLYIIIN